MRTLIIILFTVCLYLSSFNLNASALVSVTVNKYSNANESLSRLRVRSIFMMSSRYWDNGIPIQIVLLEHDRVIHKLFISNILNMSPDRYESIINAKVNSGLSKPPIKVMSEIEMLEMINRVPGSIGYVGSGYVAYKDEYGKVNFVKITEVDYD
jgi:hypothetical protein